MKFRLLTEDSNSNITTESLIESIKQLKDQYEDNGGSYFWLDNKPSSGPCYIIPRGDNSFLNLDNKIWHNQLKKDLEKYLKISFDIMKYIETKLGWIRCNNGSMDDKRCYISLEGNPRPTSQQLSSIEDWVNYSYTEVGRKELEVYFDSHNWKTFDLKEEDGKSVVKAINYYFTFGQLMESVNSDKLDSLYSELKPIQSRMNELRILIDKIKNSQEYKDLMNSYDEKNMDDFVSRYADFIKTSHFEDYSKEFDELNKKYTLLNKEASNLSSIVEKEKEDEEIKKSGLSEEDYFNKLAVKEFGYTPYFYDAGYIMKDGRMLNFSGEKGKHFSTRGQDHRAIGIIFADEEGTKAMVKFMSLGNIRIMNESPGIDIYKDCPPTDQQYSTIKSFIFKKRNEGYFSVDFTGSNCDTYYTLEYNDDEVVPSKIIEDIKDFFKNGIVSHKTSDIAKFHINSID